MYTEGSPHDSGQKLAQDAARVRTIARGLYNTVSLQCPRSLIAEDPSWETTLEDASPRIESSPLFSPKQKWNKGWAQMGLQLWKPRLIAESLRREDIREGEVVLYHDINLRKYPIYERGIVRGAKLVPRMVGRNHGLFFRDNRASVRSDVKTELLKEFVVDEDWTELKHLWAGAIAVRKTPEATEMLEEWLRLCSRFDNLCPLTSDPEAEGFSQHSLEQAVLSMLWHSKLKLGQGFVVANLRDTRDISNGYRSPIGRAVSAFRSGLMAVALAPDKKSSAGTSGDS